MAGAIHKILIATVALAFSAGLVSSATAQGLPATGSGVASDGEGRVAMFAPGGDSIALYDAVRRRQVGMSVALPRNGAGDLFRFRAIGTWGTTIMLAGFDPAAIEMLPVLGEDRLGLVDVTTGRFVWLCAGPPPLTGTGEQVTNLGTCPNGEPRNPNRPTERYYVAAGPRWLRVKLSSRDGSSGFSGIVRWTLEDDRFSWSFPTAAQRRAAAALDPPESESGFYYLRQGAPNDLASKGVREHRRWGYSHALIQNRDIRLLVRKTGDRRRTVLRLPRRYGTTTAAAAFGNRGACVRHGRTITLWDHRNRRMWRRTISAAKARATSPVIACAGTWIVLGNSDRNWPGDAGPVSWTLRWPTAKSPRGWRLGEKAVPGRTTTLR